MAAPLIKRFPEIRYTFVKFCIIKSEMIIKIKSAGSAIARPDVDKVIMGRFIAQRAVAPEPSFLISDEITIHFRLVLSGFSYIVFRSDTQQRIIKRYIRAGLPENYTRDSAVSLNFGRSA